MIRLIRHAESTFNQCGDQSRDVGLSDHGQIQAKQLTGQFDLVICSTLKRARQTLDLSQITYKNIIFTDLCREVLDGNLADLYNGETIHIENDIDLKLRIQQFNQLLQDLLTRYPTIAVISHYTFLHWLCGYYFKNAYYWDYYHP